MDGEQRRQFERKGWLVLRSAIPASHVRALNEIYGQKVQCEVAPAARAFTASNPGLPYVWHGFKKDFQNGAGLRMWGKPFYDLVNPPSVSPILEQLLGDPALEHASPNIDPRFAHRYRLDHDNIHYTAPFDPMLEPRPKYTAGALPKEYWSPAGSVRGGLHGGQPSTARPDNGMDQTGHGTSRMITCVYELLPTAAGAAGTAVLSGSHRGGATMPANALTAHHRPPWPKEFESKYGMETVQLQPGDCLIFTEKLVHASLPYRGTGERRTLFYKYLPFGVRRDSDVGVARKRYDLVSDSCITDSQKLILGWPDEWPRTGIAPKL